MKRSGRVDRPDTTPTTESQKLRARVAEIQRRNAADRQDHAGRHDAARHERAEESSDRSEQRFRLFYECSPFGCQSLNAEGRLEEVNPAWLEMLGYERDDVIGRWIGDFLTPASQKLFRERSSLFQCKGKMVAAQFDMVRKDGRVIAVEIDGCAVRDAEGGFDYSHCVVRDVTEHKRTEQALHDSEQKYRLLLENAGMGIGYFDLQGRVVLFNNVAAANVGGSPDELVGKSISDLFPPETASKCQRRLQEARDSGQSRLYDDQVQFPSGNRWFRSTYTPMMADNQQIVGVQVISDEITAIKEAETALRAERDRAQRYLDVAGVMFVVLDTNGKVVLVNKKGCEILGRRDDEILGTDWFDIAVPEHARAHVRQVFANMITGRIEAHKHIDEHVILRKDGQERWVDWRNAVLRDEQGNIVGTLSSGEDITDRKRAEEELRQSEETHRALVEGLPDVVIRFDRDGRHLFISEHVAKVVGIPADRFIGKTHRELGFAETMCRFWEEAIRKVFDSGRSYETEFSFETKRGLAIFNWRLVPEMDAQGKTQSVLTICRDVTAHRQAEQTLQDTLRTSDDIVRTIPSGLFIYQFEPPDRLVLISGNPEAERLTGIRVEDSKGREFNELWPAAKSAGLTDNYLEVARTGNTIDIEDLDYADNRLAGAFRTRAFALPQNRLAVAFENITERKRAGQRLRESEEKFRAVFDQAPDSVLLIEARTGRIVECNRHAHETLGYTREEFRNIRFQDFEATESPDDTAANMQRVLACGQEIFETKHRTKDGRVLDVLASARTVCLQGEQFFVCIWRDITERNRAQEALERHRAELEAIYDHAPVMMCVLDTDCRVLYGNRAFTEFTGVLPRTVRPDRIGHVLGCINALNDPRSCGSSPKCVACKLHLAVQDTLKTGRSHRDIKYRSKLKRNGMRSDVILRGATAMVRTRHQENLLLCLQDITEQEQAEQQAKQREAELLHVSRLSTLGEMASGFAHELNQPLSAILGFAGASVRSIQSQQADMERLRKNLEEIVSQSIRAGEIIRRIRGFAQRRQLALATVSINDIVRDVFGFLDHDVRYKQVEVLLDLSEDLPLIPADTIQMEQVLLNLMRNAVEAMDTVETGERQLTVRTKPGPRDTVKVEVSDTGPGLSPEIMAKVFDPFFTTKANGLGVGLSITHSIIEQHRGHLWVEPHDERGCTFAFTIPATPSSGDEG